MDAMKDALKRKMTGGISIEIQPLEAEGQEDMGHEDEAQDLDLINQRLKQEGKTDMAPPIDGESPDQSEILQALADKGSLGRSPSSLGERAAMGAKAKLATMKKK